MADVDDIRQGSGAMEQKISVGQFTRALGKVMDVQMSIELNNQRILGTGELIVDGQGAEMIARYPD